LFTNNISGVEAEGVRPFQKFEFVKNANKPLKIGNKSFDMLSIE